ncbi:MAG: SDR family oxidoreductase [Thermoplasmata archaeon]
MKVVRPGLMASFYTATSFALGRNMDLGLQGKVALVAAASQGLGRAIAMELSREGARVAICSRDEGRVRTTAAEIARESGGEVLPVQADVTRYEDIKAFVQEVVEAFGGVQVLVTNAGGPPPGQFADVGDEDWYSTYDLTFMSAVRLIRECLPYMKEGGWGRIIVMTSLSVKQPIDDLVLSNAVRLAVVGMAKSLAKDLAPDNITVNVAGPGFIATDRLKDLFEARADRDGTTAEEVQARLVSSIPMGRLGLPEEIGVLVAFVASERASYLTGNVIQLDGGLYRGVF